MIRKIRESRFSRGISLMLILSFLTEIIAPNRVFALTSGPKQPEFSSFTPIGTSDMVELSSGDMNYNIPLMDVGGYPLNMAYSSGISMDEEASWVGLGWNLSVGQISRNVRGIPDDFNGDQIKYEDYQKPNVNVGATVNYSVGALGNTQSNSLSVGVDLNYNNYVGFNASKSVGGNFSITNNLSIGFNVKSGSDGLSISPNVSLHTTSKVNEGRRNKTNLNFGVSMNSRQGLTSTSLGASYTYEKGTFSGNQLEDGSTGSKSVGSQVSYADQVYTPSKRFAMSTGSFTLNAALGTEIMGGEGQMQITAYGTISKVKNPVRYVNSFGYAHTEDALPYDVLDFNREKDGAFSVNTTNLPITNYTYDLYSVQGQGVSGMYRPFRNQIGYIFDPFVQDGSFSGSLGAEFGTGNTVHAGVDIEATSVHSESGGWYDDNYILQYLKETYNYNPRYEKVHYKNVGDLSVDKDFGMFSQSGSYGAIRIPFVGSKFYRKLENKFIKKKNAATNETLAVNSSVKRSQRQSRNQAINNVTIDELAKGIGYGPCVSNTSMLPAGYYKGHHIGEVQIVRNDGARYIYGLPAYNLKKVEASYASSPTGDCNTGLLPFSSTDLGNMDNPSNLPFNKNMNRVTTPAYVHTHLLTSVLSADYQDKTGNGPSADDLGSYTKFTYVKKNSAFRWRTPFQGASYNEGLKTDPKDNEGNYSYGEKELYYVDLIETKTHVARFFYSTRKDGYGVAGEVGGIDLTQPLYKLDKIALYSKPEYDQSGTNATPVKTVNFEYDYSLCKGVPNNSGVSNEGGKLTLKKIYFTYRESKMGKYTGYNFEYNNLNPDYNIKGYDSWGNYKPNNGTCQNTSTVTAAEFPYVEQDAAQDQRASAWLLSDINLPSGGTISVDYESDDYAYVQDKKALRMFKIAGVGNVQNASASSSLNTAEISGTLFDNNLLNTPTNYLYVEVPESAASATQSEIYTNYFSALEKQLIYFRFYMNMTKLGSNATTSFLLNSAKFDYVTGYVELDRSNNSEIFSKNGKYYLSVPVKLVDKEGGLTSSNQQVNPISKAGWHFARKYLSSYAYDMAVNGDSDDIAEAVNQLVGPAMLNNLLQFITGPNAALENKGISRRFIKDKSWIRLADPSGRKKGGGVRVSKIVSVDQWATMTSGQGSYQTMSYGQEYKYTLEDGVTSSGVASYEPIGDKENPFVQPVFSTTKNLLAPDEDNFIEKPFGESFFPSPHITYSRVAVSNLHNGQAPSNLTSAQVKTKHRTGKVVTEYYTTKDYPTIVDQTTLQAEEDKQESLANLLKLNVKKHFTASQGYVIHLNDMDGKQKSQRVYAEGQLSPISGVDYNYENYSTSANYNASSDPEQIRGKLNNNVRVIHPDGTVDMQTIGVEMDVVHDFRENKTSTSVKGVNVNIAGFFIGFFPLIIPTLFPDITRSRDQFRSASTTKVINTFGILKETVAYDAGSAVYTRNLAWDSETGEVLVTETVDEFNDKYYTFNYPAHWFYKGMGQAYQNLGLDGTLSASGSSFVMNNIGSNVASDFLINGDELFIETGSSTVKAWVSAVTGSTFRLIGQNGAAITGISGSFKVTRSGHRNLQSAGIMNVTLMRNPLTNASGQYVSNLGTGFLASNNWADWKIINAGAVDYSDYWPFGCECGIYHTSTYNPYVMNERGVWRTKSSRTYLTGRNTNSVTPRREGFFTSFSPMYKLTAGHSWYKSYGNWTFVSEVSRYSPYGFELENRDALNRYSGAQYGYNHTLPMAVGANTAYRELGYDGFEDYGYDGCSVNSHFDFKDSYSANRTNAQSHSGKYSIRVGAGSQVSVQKKIACGN